MGRAYDQGWMPYGPRRRGPVPSSQMRVSDAERHEIAEQLSQHYADGRLDDEEFNERVSAAMAAKTRADLEPLLFDLPRLDQGDQPVPTSQPSHGHGVLRLALFVALALFALGSVQAFFHFHFVWFALIAIVLLALRGRHHHHHDVVGSGRHL